MATPAGWRYLQSMAAIQASVLRRWKAEYLRVMIWIVDGEEFRDRCGIEISVSGNECNRRDLRTDFKSRYELHSVVATQRVLFGKPGCVINQSRWYVDDDILFGEIDKEIIEGGGGSLRREKTAPLFARDGCNRLRQRNADHCE
jgi:hypothetical protein